jgi:hypothetical protein
VLPQFASSDPAVPRGPPRMKVSDMMIRNIGELVAVCNKRISLQISEVHGGQEIAAERSE